MGSVVPNPKIVSNNQTKMPAVETSKLGVATNSLENTQFALNANEGTMQEINKKISNIKP